MAGPPTAAFVQATCVFTGSALPQGAVATFGMGLPVDPEAFEGITAAFRTFHQLMSTTNTQLNRIEFKQGPVATGQTITVPVSQNGNDGTVAAPPNTSYLLTKVVPAISGRFHGRAFWPGINETRVNEAGVIDASWRASRQDGLDDLFDAIALLTTGVYVFRSNSSDPREVNRYLLDSRVATQRRRLRR